MKIAPLNSIKKPITEIQGGEIFWWKGEFYMKISYQDRAIRICDGFEEYFYDEEVSFVPNAFMVIQ